MASLMIVFIPFLIFFVAMLVIGGVSRLAAAPADRRSPLNRDLLRGPGHSLVLQIEDLSQRIETFAIMIGVVPVLMYASYVSQKCFKNTGPGYYMGLIYLLISVVFTAWASVKLVRLQKTRRRHRLGLECEMAVGQELNVLVSHGYKVYHDVQAENSNIDHVAVGPNGVFAIETKGRSKPNRKRGSADSKVEFDGQNLIFPDSVESEPLEQARRQAQWLSGWLTSAVGERVKTKPVLALPGWYIVRRKRSDVLLLNGKDCAVLGKWKTDVCLDDVTIQRISHQLDQRCRDVEPKVYNHKKSTRWKKSAA